MLFKHFVLHLSMGRKRKYDYHDVLKALPLYAHLKGFAILSF